MTLIKEKKIIHLRDFGLPMSPQSEECRLWAYWLWVRENVEEDHDFIYRVYILRYFGLWVRYGNNGLFIYYPSLLILKVGSLSYNTLKKFILYDVTSQKMTL